MSSSVPFPSLVEHIKLMFVGAVELSRAYFSRTDEKGTKKGRVPFACFAQSIMFVGVVGCSQAYFS